ncbi:MAG: hypothetical protein Q9161_001872 [Pseudevernia consocians]
MAEVGIIASVVQIADVGLRLSIKLYTFGETVASADRSVIAISKDVSLTSGVLKELGHTLDRDRATRTFSENAVQTADGVVKECLEVFQEMENILVKKMPSLARGDGRDGVSGARTKKAMVMLERLRWGYLQPKLQLLRSNLDRLKSTLLLMLNVITYARQVSGKTESPSVIAEQRSLIDDLAHSNQEYIREFERLKLGIERTSVEQVDDAPNIGAIEKEPSTTTRSLPGAPTRKPERMKVAVGGTSLQDKENIRGFGSRELTTATKSPPKARSTVTRSLPTPLNANIGNVFIDTSVQTNTAMPPVQGQRLDSDQEVLFKQLQHYSMLIENLLKEVDEAQYKITFKSRLQVKGGIAGLHESERQELERVWGGTALQIAEQRLGSLVEGLGQLPRMNRFAASDPAQMSPPPTRKRKAVPKLMASNRGPDNGEQEEATAWSPQATPDGQPHFRSDSCAFPMEDPPQMPISVNKAAEEESRGSIAVSEDTRSPTNGMVGTHTRNDPAPRSHYYSTSRTSTGNSKNEKSSVPIAETDTKPAEEGNEKQEILKPRTYGRKESMALPVSAAPQAQMSNIQTVSPKYRMANSKSAPPAGASGYPPMSDTFANDSPYMADSSGSSQLFKEKSFTDDPDKWPSLFDPNEGETNTDTVITENPNNTVAVKRARNTMAARKSRKKTLKRKWESDAEHRNTIALNLDHHFEHSYIGGAESRQKGGGSGEGEAEPKTSPVSVSPQRPSAGEQIQTGKRPVNQSAVPDQLATQQQDTAMSGFNGLDGGVDASYSMPFNSDLNNPDILENFDFEKFLQTTDGDFNFDPSTFDVGDGVEIGGSEGPFAGLEGCVVTKDGTVEDTTVGALVGGNAETLVGRAAKEDGKHENESPFAGLEGLVVVADGWVEDENQNNVGIIIEGDLKVLVGRTVKDNGNVIEKRGNVLGHAEPYEGPEEKEEFEEEKEFKEKEEFEEEEEEVKADLSILMGLAVNKQGMVIGPEDVPIARLVEGNAKELVDKKCDEKGQLWNDISEIIGRCELIPVNEREAKPEGPFAGLEGCVVIKDAFVEDEDGNRVGVVVEGNANRLIGRAVDEDGDIIDRYGNVKGRAEPYEEAEEEIAVLSRLEEKVMSKPENFVDEHGLIHSHTVERDLGELKVDDRGQTSNDKRDSSLFQQLEAEESHGYPEQRPLGCPGIPENPSAIACTACRGKRIKCDLGEPNCVHCEQSGSECTYNNTTSLNQGAGPDLASNVIPNAKHPEFQRDNRFLDSAAKLNMEDDPRFFNQPKFESWSSCKLPASNGDVPDSDPGDGYSSVNSVFGRGMAESWQRESEQDHLRLADREVVDRLVSLWTTVKPL